KGAPTTKRSRWTLSRVGRYVLVAVTALFIVFIAVVLLTPRPMFVVPAPTSIPVAGSVNALTAGLQKAGIPVSAARNLPISSSPWKANQIMQYDLHNDSGTGTLIVLSYRSASMMASDSAKVSQSDTFKGWQLLTAPNLILLISPETNQRLRSEIS